MGVKSFGELWILSLIGQIVRNRSSQLHSAVDFKCVKVVNFVDLIVQLLGRCTDICLP
jgi:hypothetical protein